MPFPYWVCQDRFPKPNSPRAGRLGVVRGKSLANRSVGLRNITRPSDSYPDPLANEVPDLRRSRHAASGVVPLLLDVRGSPDSESVGYVQGNV
jgi:hypothetical protein